MILELYSSPVKSVCLLSLIVFFCCSTEPQEKTIRFDGTTQPTEKKAVIQGISVLTGFRISKHPGYERMVFEFVKEVPTFRIEYIQKPYFLCGSGKELVIRGDQLLHIRFTDAQAHDENGKPTVPRASASLSTIEEILLVCDFEGELSFIAGLRQKIPYRHSLLVNPARLVIDFKGI
jgi:hypothetical protein